MVIKAMVRKEGYTTKESSERRTPPKGYPKDIGDYLDPGNLKYPVDTEAHVRSALSYFSAHDDKYPPEERRKMWGKLIRAAEQMGIEISEDVAERSEKSKEDLAAWKKKLIDALGEEREEKAIIALIKSKGYPAGTIREWRGKKYKKLTSGKWVRTYSGEGGRGEQQAIRNVMRKIQGAKSMEELAAIVSENMQRFKDENGKTLPVVKEFLDAARGTEHGKKEKAPNKVSYSKDKVEKLRSVLSVPQQQMGNLLAGENGERPKAIEKYGEWSDMSRKEKFRAGGLVAIDNALRNKDELDQSRLNIVANKMLREMPPKMDIEALPEVVEAKKRWFDGPTAGEKKKPVAESKTGEITLETFRTNGKLTPEQTATEIGKKEKTWESQGYERIPGAAATADIEDFMDDVEDGKFFDNMGFDDSKMDYDIKGHIGKLNLTLGDNKVSISATEKNGVRISASGDDVDHEGRSSFVVVGVNGTEEIKKILSENIKSLEQMKKERKGKWDKKRTDEAASRKTAMETVNKNKKYSSLSPRDKGRVDVLLDKKYSTPHGVETMRDMILSGYVTGISEEEVSAVKWNRQKFNRMNEKEQKEYKKRLEDTKKEYWAETKDGTAFKTSKLLYSVFGDEKMTRKSIVIVERMAKGRALPAGTIREWNGQKMKKTGDGKWVPTDKEGAVKPEEKKPTPREIRERLGDDKYDDFITQLQDDDVNVSGMTAEEFDAALSNFEKNGDIYGKKRV